MTKITAKGSTFLKREPIDSSKLDAKSKVPIRANQVIQCATFLKTNKGHRQIQLVEPCNGYYHWWIFSAHWDISPGFITADSINWNVLSCPVSKYFTVHDVISGDYRRIPTDPDHIQNILTLAKELDKIRDAWGSAIGVTSWYRPEPINSQVGGILGSTHTKGIAADIFPYHGDEYAFEEWLDQFWGERALGYGQKAGRGFTHVDLRTGYLRWNY